MSCGPSESRSRTVKSRTVKEFAQRITVAKLCTSDIVYPLGIGFLRGVHGPLVEVPSANVQILTPSPTQHRTRYFMIGGPKEGNVQLVKSSFPLPVPISLFTTVHRIPPVNPLQDDSPPCVSCLEETSRRGAKANTYCPWRDPGNPSRRYGHGNPDRVDQRYPFPL
jgi:hypothetical protein